MRVLILVFLGLIHSCSNDGTIGKAEMWKKGRAVDPSIEIVLPKTIADGIKCSDYGPGCLNGFTVKARGLEMICVQFSNRKEAEQEALRIDQYYAHNWVFDDVTDEPLLERFVAKAFNAIRPLKLTPTPVPASSPKR